MQTETKAARPQSYTKTAAQTDAIAQAYYADKLKYFRRNLDGRCHSEFYEQLFSIGDGRDGQPTAGTTAVNVILGQR